MRSIAISSWGWHMPNTPLGEVGDIVVDPDNNYIRYEIVSIKHGWVNLLRIYA